MNSVSLRLNLLANAVGQLYTALVGILMLPVFYDPAVLGPASVGLIGFYTLLMFWFNLLDVGMTPTVSRDTTRFLAGQLTASHYFSLLLPMLLFFLLLAVGGGGSLLFAAPRLASDWLGDVSFSPEVIEQVLWLTALILPLRLLAGLLRGLVAGAERLLWLNSMNVLLTTIRYVLVLPVLALAGHTVVVFFCVQLFAAVLELLLLCYKSGQILAPRYSAWQFSWQPFRLNLSFAASAALLSLLGVALTQLDKVLLSGALPLAQYGELTMALTLSSGLLLLSTMLGGAVQPRLTALLASQGTWAVHQLYLRVSQWLVALVGSAAIVVVFAQHQLLFAWTGSAVSPALLNALLPWYAIGTMLMAFNGLAYYLQFAAGQLHYHLYCQSAVLVVWGLFLFHYLEKAGAVGAAMAWAAIQLILLLVYVLLVHRRYLAGLHRQWLLQSVVAILLPVIALNQLCAWLIPQPESRAEAIGWLLFQSVLTLLTAIVCSADLRNLIQKTLRKSVREV